MYDTMNELELKKIAVEKYLNLQRIKYAKDVEDEIALQESALEIELASYGITDLNKLQPKHE